MPVADFQGFMLNVMLELAMWSILGSFIVLFLFFLVYGYLKVILGKLFRRN